jgi:hypothetical protein
MTLARIVVAILMLAAVAACRSAAPTVAPDVVAISRASVPGDPGDAAWDDAPVHVAPLLLQDLVEPRLMTPSTPDVQVRAITDGTRLAFRLDWTDATVNDRPTAGHFVDACAVQLPVQSGPDLPAPQMGEMTRPVEITVWRASWQAMVDGRGDHIQDLFPGAPPMHYPFDAASLEPGSAAQREMASRYAPARALGNMMAGPKDRPVQDLLAEGPGTLTPAASSDSQGRGRHGQTGWSVVIVRRLPAGLRPGSAGNVALAVWDGERDEAGSRKMRTGWIRLTVQP